MELGEDGQSAYSISLVLSVVVYSLMMECICVLFHLSPLPHTLCPMCRVDESEEDLTGSFNLHTDL